MEKVQAAQIVNRHVRRDQGPDFLSAEKMRVEGRQFSVLKLGVQAVASVVLMEAAGGGNGF